MVIKGSVLPEKKEENVSFIMLGQQERNIVSTPVLGERDCRV